MLKIGLFSKLSRISIRMLRYYDENGLLTPGEVDPATGYRYYHESQLMEAERLLALREMGFGVEAMGAILRAYQDPEALGQFLRVRREELRAELEKTRQRLALLETTLERVGKDGIIMEYNVTLKELPRRQVASLREVIPSYWQEGELWGRMMTETAGQNLQIAEPCYSIAIFHDKLDRRNRLRDQRPHVQHLPRGPCPDRRREPMGHRGLYAGGIEVVLPGARMDLGDQKPGSGKPPYRIFPVRRFLYSTSLPK